MIGVGAVVESSGVPTALITKKYLWNVSVIKWHGIKAQVLADLDELDSDIAERSIMYAHYTMNDIRKNFCMPL